MRRAIQHRSAKTLLRKSHRRRANHDALGFQNTPYLSGEFLDALRFTGEKARELGLRMDLTLGSGWPFGGPHIPVTQAAGKLRVERFPITVNTASIPIPYLVQG